MKLHVHELQSTLEQSFTPDKIVNVEAVRLHLYRHSFAAGSLKVQIRNQNGLVAESNAVAISDIAPGSSFFHGMIRFDVSAQLKKNTTYFVRLVSTGYSFNESAYVGWCTDFDFGTYPKSPDALPALVTAFDYEIWVRK